VRAALLGLVTLLPELFGCAPTLAAVRNRLGVAEALIALRALAARKARGARGTARISSPGVRGEKPGS
jgi:hypothetical protein